MSYRELGIARAITLSERENLIETETTAHDYTEPIESSIRPQSAKCLNTRTFLRLGRNVAAHGGDQVHFTKRTGRTASIILDVLLK